MQNKDRIFILAKEDPKDKDVGLLDPQLFEDKNHLHCYMDTQSGMWRFKYEHGTVPPVLRDKFTSFKQAREFAEFYFGSKKIKVVGIRD